MTNRYIEIPGSDTHELPPLLVHYTLNTNQENGLDSVMTEAEDMLSDVQITQEQRERRKLDLALQLTKQYKGLLSHWLWGDSVLEWIRQCEITFECEEALKKLLHPDIWPHASRASFVTLLLDKNVRTKGVELQKAVGLRLTFRQPPPIDCFSNQFLFYLNNTVANSAYEEWSHMVPNSLALLPPERFHFDVVDISN